MLLPLLLPSSGYARPRPSPDVAHLTFGPDRNKMVEQVHIQLGAQDQMTLVYASFNKSIAPAVTYWNAKGEQTTQHKATGQTNVYSQLLYFQDWLSHPPIGKPTGDEKTILNMQNTAAWAIDPVTGDKTGAWAAPTKVKWWDFGDYFNPKMVYNSPFIHQVVMEDLQGGETYSYQISGDIPDRKFQFTMPPRGGMPAYPMSIGVIADIGQTSISKLNMDLLAELRPSVVLLAGDLSYADGFAPRWDSYGRMAERLNSAIPVMTTGGNHEVGSGEAWTNYLNRYPMPHRSSGSPSGLWWSRDIGPAHVVSLCSYAATSVGSPQYDWLYEDLNAVNRSLTPWLIVMMHAPWYSSNSNHWEEADLSRRDFEPLLVEHGVDLVISGHVHAYERTFPMVNFLPHKCGPMYVNVGDAGNHEGAALPYREPQPMWSAFREGSFGIGMLELVNASHAYFHWNRTACESATSPDHISFNATCESILASGQRDNSNNSARSDYVWLIRPLSLRTECRRSWKNEYSSF